MTPSRTVALVLAALLAGCSRSPVPNATKDAALGDALAADGGTSVETQADSARSAREAGPQPAPSACVESPLPRPGARSVVTATVEVTYAGKPVTFGEPFPLPGGGTLTLGNFRFYVAELALLTRTDESLPVDLVSADGTPVPYNVHLVNAGDQAGMTFRFAAPAGDYTGLSFVFGLTDACNRSDPARSKPPLTHSSEMTWPPPFGYLFLRYEGNLVGPTAQDARFTAIAMGGQPPAAIVAPRVEADGVLRVTSTPGGTARLRVALDEIFKAASLPANVDGILVPPDGIPFPGGPEIVAGEHLRQNATKVPIFSVTSGP